MVSFLPLIVLAIHGSILIDEGMVSEIARVVGSEELKYHLVETLGGDVFP